MKGTTNLVALLATSSFQLSYAGPVPESSVLQPRDDDPEFEYPGLLAKVMPDGMAPGACAEKNDYSTVDSRVDIWFHGHGGDLAEYYLRQNSYDNWHQGIFKTMFPHANPSDFDCSTGDAECKVPGDCSEFEKRHWPSAFYLFSSLQNIHTFFHEYEDRLDRLKGDMSNDIPTLAHDFGADKESDKSLNFFAMIGAALGMSAGITAADPLVSGTFGAMAGFAGLIANSAGKPNQDSGVYKLGKIESELAGIVNKTVDDARTNLQRISGAIFGVPGSTEVDIPAQMKYDEGQGYEHAIPQVFANGQWLLDNPTDGLASDFNQVGRQFRQTLAWNLLRLFHNAFVVIIDNIDNAQDCANNQNFVWDFKWSWCWGLAEVTDKDPKTGDSIAPTLINIGDKAKPLWEKYGAEAFPTYRNTYDCWQANGAHAGDIDLNANPEDTTVTRCFFGMEMKKGSIEGIFPSSFYLKLDPNFQNFPDDSMVDNGGKKIPNTCVDPDHCDQWPVSHRWALN